jgi:uncharacterized protein (UPF0276 family)
MIKIQGNETLSNTDCPAPAPKTAAILNYSVWVTMECRICDILPSPHSYVRAAKGLARAIRQNKNVIQRPEYMSSYIIMYAQEMKHYFKLNNIRI